MPKKPEVRIPFNRKVDSGPLPKDADASVRQVIQNERIRRQRTSQIKPSPRKP